MVTLADLAQRFGGDIRGDGQIAIEGVASLKSAGAHDISYVASKHYYSLLARTTAGAVILRKEDLERFDGNALVTDHPRLCFAKIATSLSPQAVFAAGVHMLACVHARAGIAETASVGPYANIEAGAMIANRVVVGPGCHIGANAQIGEGSRLVARVVIGHGCVIGKHCVVHPGAVIGSDGFGYVKDGQSWLKIPQLGRVVVGNDVEIGANTAIDRGALDDTVIGDGVKLDNLIQIAHNVCIGEYSAIAACVGVAGSTHIGRYCTVGGQAGIIDHLDIADHVHITAGSLVTSSITRAGTYSSSLRAEPAAKWKRSVARLLRLDDMAKQVKQLQAEIARLSEARKS